MSTHGRSTILFVGAITADQAAALKSMERMLHRPICPVLLYSSALDFAPQIPNEIAAQLVAHAADFNNPADLAQKLNPYADDIMAVACKDDDSAVKIRNLAPHLHDVPLPSSEALLYSTDKTLMRSKLRAYDASLSPRFTTATNALPETIKRIEQTVGYPLIVKPASLSSSLLVAACYDHRQLTEALRHIVRYAGKVGQLKPQIMVEQLMERGDYYSIDAYVSSLGDIQFTPPTRYTTGRDVGFDDFFGYLRITPAGLTKKQVAACENVASAAIKALQLTCSTCHVELMLTPEGWKIIEVGPRLGGFRHELYSKAYGINHALNDLLVRSERSPVIPTTPRGHAAALQFYAYHEGTLQEIHGLETIKSLKSLQRVALLKTFGDPCRFAKHGGSPVLEVVLYNKDKRRLHDDIRIIEDTLDIVTDATVKLPDSKPSRVKAIA